MIKTIHCLAFVAAAFMFSCEKQESAAKTEPLTPTNESAPVANTPESLAKEVASLQDQLALIMESIKDAATAEKAIESVGPVAERFAEIGKVIEGMDKKTSPEVDAQLKEIVKPAKERLQNAMAKAMPIITATPGLAEKMQNAMSKMSSK